MKIGKYDLTNKDIPALIHGEDKAGASYFTMRWVHDLFDNGEKLLFISALPQAKEGFMEKTKDKATKRILIETEYDLISNPDKEAILLKNPDEKLFDISIKKIPDIKERVVIIKNIDAFSKKIYESVQHLQKVIFSGNVDMCSWRGSILSMDLQSRIFFSESEYISLQIPQLQKYEGYFTKKNYNQSFILES